MATSRESVGFYQLESRKPLGQTLKPLHYSRGMAFEPLPSKLTECQENLRKICTW